MGTTSINIASHLGRMAAEQPDALAVVCPRGRSRPGRPRHRYRTYRQLDDETDAVACGLERYGIGRGVRTVLMVRPGLELFTIAFALLKAGAVPVLIDPGIGRRHLAGCIAIAEPEAFIGVPLAHLARMLLGWGKATVRRLVTVGPWAPWAGVTLEQLAGQGRAAGSYEKAATEADDTAAIVFTSGSTGPPKGVVYSHGNFAAQLAAVGSLLGVSWGDVDLPTFPLFALFDPALGMTTVVPDMDPTRPASVDPLRIIGPVIEFGVTTMFGSPALLDTVSRYGAPRGVKLPSLQRVVSAGAPVSAEIIERFQAMLPPDGQILTPYGATEALPVAVISSDAILSETRELTDRGAGVCVGRPVDSIELEVISVSDEPIDEWRDELRLPTGEIGEIAVRGPQVTRSYYRSERHDRLAKIVDPAGGFWHRMGDLGYLDEQGRLWFVGRKSHRVETADETLYPVPCEAVFNTHPEVYRSALVGIPSGGAAVPVLCVELERSVRGADQERLTAELLEIGARHDHTRQIQTVLYPRRFPVDIRHNSKIKRGELATWATKKLGLRG
jgi:acyl-CoA synthetase (AMP-forming)/AMP-acid ligase II